MTCDREINKILIVHPHLDYPNGATKYIINLLNQLAVTTNFEISLITLYNSKSMENLLSSRIELLTLNEALPKSFKFWTKLHLLRKRINNIIEWKNPDIVLVNVFPANWMVKTNIDIPIIWICHEPSAFIHYSHIRKGLPLKLRLALTPLSLQLFHNIDIKIACSYDLIIANSEFTKSEIKRIYGMNAVKIYPGLDPELISTQIKPIPEARNFGVISPLSKVKRVDHLLKSAAILKQKNIEFNLNIAGDGPYKEHLINQSKQLKLSENVRFLGRISQNKLANFYSEQRFIVYPRFNEPFGLVPIEAMSQGRAVIACIGGGPSETIIHNKTGLLVPPNDIIAMANAINHLLENSDIATEMGINGIIKSRKYYSWTNATQQYLKFMNSLGSYNKKASSIPINGEHVRVDS